MKPYNRLTREEKLACVSLYPKEALKDEDNDIRLGAYRVLGAIEEAMKDESWYIRLEAYRAMGFTEEALKDKSWLVRNEAQLYFEVKNK